jgi:hypothetical protein
MPCGNCFPSARPKWMDAATLNSHCRLGLAQVEEEPELAMAGV